MNIYRKILFGLLLVPLMIWGIGALVGGAETVSKNRISRAEFMMNTIITITAYDDEKTASAAIEAAFDAMRSVDAMASFYREDSELSRLNRELSIKASASFARLLSLASEAYFRTDGAFDPTCAAAAKIWGFHDRHAHMPTDDEIQRVKAHSGWERCVVFLPENASIPEKVKLAEGASIDLGGIAGGMAVEAAADAMRKCGCKAFIIDDCGDIWVEGDKPDGTLWRIAVKDPDRSGNIAVLSAKAPFAVSTSGDYEQFLEIAGCKYGHIIDVKKGTPCENFKSVTVKTASAIESDMLSTALFAMQPAKAYDFVEKNNIPALFITASGAVRLSSVGKRYFQVVLP